MFGFRAPMLAWISSPTCTVPPTPARVIASTKVA